MKKLLLGLIAVCFFGVDAMAQEFKVVTVVESIVPMGLGRSRIIEAAEDVDSEAATTERTEGQDSKQGKVRRKDLKIDDLKETKLLNFYSGVGINFQNIASNDALIGDRISSLAQQGWKLVFVTSGVESDAGDKDGKGIYITRFIFQKD
ncbi:hypothetical protein [Luteibaculum oceani]|uniref:DUF4177 domain-containing protein n=1 Tax=Luteibaculum oceani TaxID=1294296 RepID=A0A5C6UZD8_9FLAO|nr:hypothetical protein [Luteibaculum oceani]TXC78803.1 hypothetical protein FRX97_06215 [Luteibaculum oceani]